MTGPSGLYWEAHGAKEGPALILSAGLGGHGAYWKPHIEALGQKARIFLYDHRGTGHSEPETRDGLLADGLGEDIERLMDEIGLDKAVVVGHAAGAIAALALARRAPERLSGIVSVNGWARTDAHFRRCIAMRMAVLEAGGPEAYLRAQPVFLFPPVWVSSHDADLDAQLPKQVAEFQGEATLRRRAHALLNFDILDDLPTIATPTLVVAADDDMLVPSACSEVLMRGLPHATLARMPWGGHACNITCPEAFNRAVLDWLATLPDA
ncbi:pyrimidine utilization protein D [Novosphingobium nitrogenifigens]|nr:pyrimidine utilization protein D [Novosphingobium nitrogenifigens]